MALISLQDVSLGFGGPLLLEAVNLQIERGEAIGLLGLEHSGENEPACSAAGANSNPCYGVNQPELVDVMGKGARRKEWHAAPWRRAMEKLTGRLEYEWGVKMKRHYPRTLDEVNAGKWPTSYPR